MVVKSMDSEFRQPEVLALSFTSKQFPPCVSVFSGVKIETKVFIAQI